MGPGDREFVIYPSYGAAVKMAGNRCAPAASAIRFINSKKPFDWMSDEQFNGLQVRASYELRSYFGNLTFRWIV